MMPERAHPAPSIHLALVIAFGLAFNAASAQSAFRVQAQQPDGAPISGALIGIIAADGRVVAESVTDDRGFRTLIVPAGKYHVRLRRIGYQPFVSGEVNVPYDGTFRITADARRVQLQSVLVTSRSACRRTDQQDGIATVWEENSKALLGAKLTREDLINAGTSISYQKQVSYSGEILSTDTARSTIAGSRPFSAVNPTFLATQGYVIGDEVKGWEYFGPDEAVLLSSTFAEAHCFRLVRDKKRTGQLGLSFEPSPGRRTADIAGTLWLDEKSSELIELDFRFVNAGVLSQFKPIGFVHFRRVASGAWLVDRWFLRFPQLERRVANDPLVQTGFSEQGGFIAADGAERVTSGVLHTLRGQITDSVTHEPLRNAEVSIGSNHAITDSNGLFALTSVPGGTQTISFRHPFLSAFGFVAIEKSIEIDSDSVVVALATPSLATLWHRVCRDANPDVPVEERGIIHGWIRDAAGHPVANASLQFQWLAYTPAFGERSNVPRRSLLMTSDAQGHYVACGFRRLSTGDVVATKDNARSESAHFDFNKSLLVRRDLIVK
jgi:hypothetical protein